MPQPSMMGVTTMRNLGMMPMGMGMAAPQVAVKPKVRGQLDGQVGGERLGRMSATRTLILLSCGKIQEKVLRVF